jgi:hypothetical protein
MSEVNYRRNGNKYSSSGKCWGLSPKIGIVKEADKSPRPKSSRERRAAAASARAEARQGKGRKS